MKSLLRIGFLLAGTLPAALAQTSGTGAAPNSAPQGERRGQGGGRMMFGGGGMGTITAIDGANLTIKTGEGKAVTIKTSGQTRFLGRDRLPIELKELKVGDTVMAGGENSGDTVDARLVALVDPLIAKRLEEQRAALGKTMIAGEIKEIHETKLTILRPDGQTQVIELDENSSLKKGQESVTLGDIKVGERIFGTGELKDGTFLVKELRVGGGGGMQFRRNGTGEARPEPPKKDTPKPEQPK